MFKIALQGLLARSSACSTTALAVTLGVAFMAGTLVLTDTVGPDLRRPVRRRLQGHRRRGPGHGRRSTDRRHRRAAPASTPRCAARLRRVDGVADAEGSVFGYARLIGKDGEALGNPANGAPTLGVNWTGDRAEPVAAGGRARPAGRQPGGDRQEERRRTGTSGSATPRRCWCRAAAAAGPGRRDRRASAPPTARAGPPSCCSPPPARSGSSPSAGQVRPASWSPPSRGLAAAARRQPQARCCPHGLEAVTGAAITAETQDQVAQVDVVLQHLPAGLRGRRAAGRRLHDLQHVLDHGRPAHPGERPAAGAGRQQAPGPRLGADRGRGGGHHRVR